MEADLHIGAHVACTDGPAGRLRQVVVDPHTAGVTHLIVDVQEHFGFPVLVPRQHVVTATHERVQLNCTQHDLKTMDPFQEVMFTAPERQHDGQGYLPSQFLYPAQGGLIGPLAAPPTLPPVIEDQVPAEEGLIGPNSSVEATDGSVGQVEDIQTDPQSGRLTHVIVRSGHLWAAHSVALPVSAIERVEEGAVHLTLTRAQVAALARSAEQAAAPPPPPQSPPAESPRRSPPDVEPRNPPRERGDGR